MKITILNGSVQPGSQLDTYLADLSATLQQGGHSVQTLTPREMTLAYCTGCFECWMKTPGVCKAKDDCEIIERAAINSDFVLLAAPLIMGFPSAMLKKAMDKLVPLIHPYFAVVNNEAHHRARYKHYPVLGLLIEDSAAATPEQMALVTDIHSRTALNFKSRLAFSHTTRKPVAETAQAILQPGPGLPFEQKLTATRGVNITPPRRMVIFNGSPRGQGGNTLILEKQFVKGFTTVEGCSAEIFTLTHLKEIEACKQAFASADAVLLGFPLYTDSMPGLVKNFIEALEPFRGQPNLPGMAFLVQSGFPEATHSRHIERYLQNLAGQLGAPYLGTIVRGGVEGIQIMPENMTKDLFTHMENLGRGMAETGSLLPAELKALAPTEKYPSYLAPVFKLLSYLPVLNFYWDDQLKKNGVFKERFAAPYRQD